MDDSSLKSRIVSTAARYGLFSDAPGRCILMVSGGADSVALARLVPELFQKHTYTILHVNHGLRGEDAKRDEAFVCNLADELGILPSKRTTALYQDLLLDNCH